MNKAPESFGLSCPDGREAQLLSVQVHGEVLGLMLRLTVRQTWRNASGAPMATRLRFPLGWDQTLLDLHIERPQGTQALDKVTRESRSCCSATPGVLGTGEQVTLQWRIGQLLDLQGSSLRVQLPAALVPASPRPAQIQLEIHDPVAQGTVSCPSHNMHKVRHANGLTLTLRAPHGLDKDLVLTAHGLRDTGFALASPDRSAPGQCTVLMSASPRLPTAAPMPLRMKLLVDSSSAMPAERLSQIRSALDKLLAQLQAEDQLSYSRFGERTLHDLPRLQVCTEAYQRRVRALARHTDTDLGAAQPLAALQAALAVTNEDEEPVTHADILLITASPVWAIEETLRALRAAGHRLHVMALGEATASLWPELALASGGHCELLAPGQHSLQTLTRLIERMRQQQTVQAHLVLGGAQSHGSATQQTLKVEGDTWHLWVQGSPETSEQDLTGCPQLQAHLAWQNATDAPRTLQASAVLWDEQGDVSRVCAARQARLLQDSEARQAWLARHHLIEADASRLAASSTPPLAQASPEPLLQRPKVLPVAPTATPAMVATVDTPTARPVPQTRTTTTPPVRAMRPMAPRHTDLAGWLGEPQAPGNPLTALVNHFNTHAGTYNQFRAALSSTLHQVPTRFLDGLVLGLTRQAGNPARVWALLLHWLHTEHDMPLQAPALELVERELSSLPVAVRTQVHAALALAALPQPAQQAA
jgi:von Willebrand factor type A domain